MKKSYVRMNGNDNCLSLGNIIDLIKKVSNNSSASQTEIFCTLFNINDVNATTISNYCIGIRAIGLEYRDYIEKLYIKYSNDNSVFMNTISSILNILNNNVSRYDFDDINSDNKLNILIEELFKIAKKDKNINQNFINNINNKNNYDSFVEFLYYAVCENKQPIYKQDISIEIDKKELEKYLKIKLYFGQTYYSSLIELAKKGNSYAQCEVGSLYFAGDINGYPEYDKSYEYYYASAKKNQPKACWMVANLMITNKVQYNFDIMWEYLNKSISFGSAAGYNTLGICYLNGKTPDNNISIDKAIKYFKISSEMGYSYAFNNLGKIYEKSGDINKAIQYYKISADMCESWALNKVGEYYRKNGNLELAFIYYNKAIECPLKERNPYAYYNLATYYYKNGFNQLNIDKSNKKYEEYMSMFEKLKK